MFDSTLIADQSPHGKAGDQKGHCAGGAEKQK